ncbi:MAG: mechanosensitive ion channel protein MscS [Nevskia sp.]|nr:mechanosensitive ion channel protein MscS [Nevskia sp.]
MNRYAVSMMPLRLHATALARTALLSLGLICSAALLADDAAGPTAPAIAPAPAEAATAFAPPAAAPVVAAAPAATRPAVAPAGLGNSLDNVIQTLENDQSRAALLAQLKDLRAATAQADGTVAEDDTPGLLGAVASGFDSIQSQLRTSDTVLQFWSRRLNAASQQIGTLFTRSPEPLVDSLTMFLRVLGLWAGIAVLLLAIGYGAERLLKLPRPLPPDVRTRDLLLYVLARVAPWVIAFYVTVHFTVTPAPSLGRMFALTFAYTVVFGTVFTTVCLLLFSLFGGGHRRAAFRVLLRRAPILLFFIGALAALGDATTNTRVVAQLGRDLAIVVSTLANLTAASLAAVFVLRFRRAVSHLIRNSSYSVRHASRFNTEALRLFAAIWHLPILLLVTISSLATVLSIHHDNLALRRAIATSGLLVLGFLATALIRRGFVLASAQRARRLRAAPYAERFLKVLHAVMVLALWLTVVELTSRLWGGSAWNWMHSSAGGQRVATSLIGIASTVLAGSVLWIVLDTAIREAISPSRPRRGHVPSTRALTVLPLVRNALFLLLLVIGVIATLANLGIDVTPLIAGAGVIGIALGLGAQTLVKDLLTGVFILIEDTLAVGEVVEMDGRSGTVEGLTIRTVRLRDGDGAVHAIPFSEIKTIKNQSREYSYAVFNTRVTYDSDVDEALKLIRETGVELLKETSLRRDIIGSIEVFGLDRFDAGAVVLQSRLKTRPLRQYDVGRAFNRLLKEKIDASKTTRFAIGEQLLRMLPAPAAVTASSEQIAEPAAPAAVDHEGAPHAP